MGLSRHTHTLPLYISSILNFINIMDQWNQTIFNQYFPNVSNLTANDKEIAKQWAQWVREQWGERHDRLELLREFRTVLKAKLPDTHIALETMTALDYTPPLNPNVNIAHEDDST